MLLVAPKIFPLCPFFYARFRRLSLLLGVRGEGDAVCDGNLPHENALNHAAPRSWGARRSRHRNFTGSIAEMLGGFTSREEKGTARTLMPTTFLTF